MDAGCVDYIKLSLYCRQWNDFRLSDPLAKRREGREFWIHHEFGVLAQEHREWLAGEISWSWTAKMSDFQNLLQEINQVTSALSELGIRLLKSLLHGAWLQFWFLIAGIEIAYSSVCAVYVEEGKESRQNTGDAFKWLRGCSHEAGDSVVLCTRLKLHGFSQPPILMWLSHKFLLCTVTYLCVTVVANSLFKKEVMFKRKLRCYHL